MDLDAKAIVVLEANLKSVSPSGSGTSPNPSSTVRFRGAALREAQVRRPVATSIAYRLPGAFTGGGYASPSAATAPSRETWPGASSEAPCGTRMWPVRHRHLDEHAGRQRGGAHMPGISRKAQGQHHQAEGSRPRHGPMFRNMVVTLFNLMRRSRTSGHRPSGASRGHIRLHHKGHRAPVPIKVGRERLYRKFREGFNTQWDSTARSWRVRTSRR